MASQSEENTAAGSVNKRGKATSSKAAPPLSQETRPPPAATETPGAQSELGGPGRRRRYHEIMAEKEEKEEEKEEENQRPGAEQPRSARNTRPRSISTLAVVQPPREMTPPLSSTEQRQDEPSTMYNAEWAAPIYSRVTVKVNGELLEEATRFTIPRVKAECDERIARRWSVKSGKTLVPASLVEIGAAEKFVQYITGIGFDWLLEIEKTRVPVVLVQEFFTTFRFQNNGSVIANEIEFRLFGKTVRMSLTEWSVRLGLYTERQAEAGAWLTRDLKQPEEIEDFDPQAFWKLITTNAPPYNTKTSKATCIKHPVLRLAQVYLRSNLLGQVNTTLSITLAELYFMWCMMEPRKVHLGYWIAYACHTIATHPDRNLDVCHILGTFMRRNFSIIYDNVKPPRLCPSPELFGISLFVRTKMVKMVRGRYHLMDQSGNIASLSPARALETPESEDEELQLTRTNQEAQAEDVGETSTSARPQKAEAIRQNMSSKDAPPPKRK